VFTVLTVLAPPLPPNDVEPSVVLVAIPEVCVAAPVVLATAVFVAPSAVVVVEADVEPLVALVAVLPFDEVSPADGGSLEHPSGVLPSTRPPRNKSRSFSERCFIFLGIIAERRALKRACFL
jgi:hypothetical protein